jgi:hypothetical protein
VVADWEKIREAVERMQRSTHPHSDLFTSVPPKERHCDIDHAAVD